MKNKITLAIIGIMVLGIVSVAGLHKVKANRLAYGPVVANTTASSSPAYIGPTTNAGTSTLVIDANDYSPGIAYNGFTLNVISTASTSNITQKFTIEYSQVGLNGLDCSTGGGAGTVGNTNCDWYQDNATTTTNGLVITNTNGNTFTVAGNATASTTRFSIPIRTPMRYTRITVNAITASSSIYMQAVPLREVAVE